jgi:hypothetical protein
MQYCISRRKSIQYVGEIFVSGISIEAATQKIKAAMSKVYSTIGSGQSQVAVSLSRIRTIRVTIIGSSNQEIIPFLHWQQSIMPCLGGGPGKNESYRNIN